MSAISLSYRSTKDSAPLEIRLSFRVDGVKNPFSFYTRSQIVVDKSYWTELHYKTDFPNYKDIDKQKWVKEIKSKQYEINNEIDKIKTYLFSSFNSIPQSKILEVVNKKWLEEQVNLYYNPEKPEDESEKNKIPTLLIEYIDFYIDYRKNEMKPTSVKKYNVVKHKLERFEKKRKKKILIKDVNEDFKKEWVNFLIEEQYAANTMQRELVAIKTFCRHAKFLGLEVSHQLESLKLERVRIDKIYLTLNDLDKIQNIDSDKLTDSLINAKDWLIISCYCGQRVSDFMRFNSNMIRIEDGRKYIEFTQQKTDKNMTLPLHPKILEILEKRSGEFPYKISDQKYNDYIKEVCKIAGLFERINGSKAVTENGKTRKKEGLYEKWELVTSHIGRRSFATNFYGTIPTTYLIYATGHSSESEFLNYIGKSNKDLAKELFNYF